MARLVKLCLQARVAGARGDVMIQVTVAGMILDQQTRGPVLLLHIPPLDKYLPVWIGPSEAASISMALKKERFERPLTHDLLVTIIDGLDGRVTKVVVTSLVENTFYAKIYITRGQQVIGIDARPSDSIAIAIRSGSPIFVAEEVLEKEKEHLLQLDDQATELLQGQEPAAGDVEAGQETGEDEDVPDGWPPPDEPEGPGSEGDEP
jgi:bifunctional DNase/RNase